MPPIVIRELPFIGDGRSCETDIACDWLGGIEFGEQADVHGIVVVNVAVSPLPEAVAEADMVTVVPDTFVTVVFAGTPTIPISCPSTIPAALSTVIVFDKFVRVAVVIAGAVTVGTMQTHKSPFANVAR
jgi:hypothetical protein